MRAKDRSTKVMSLRHSFRFSTGRHNTVDDQQAVKSEPGLIGHLKNSSIASRGEGRLGALPKNCHLLPSTAISYRQIRYARFNRFKLGIGPWSLVLGPRSLVLGPHSIRLVGQPGPRG
jgi:hypothetical protein